MKSGPNYIVKLRRRRENKTNYNKRLKLLISRKTKLVIRKSNKYITIQAVDYNEKGDKVILTLTSKFLSKLDWPLSYKNLPAAYLTGLKFGLLAKKKGLKNLILDMGLYTPTKGNKIFAALKGVLDAGINVPHSEEKFPSEERIKGEHINFKGFETFKKKILEESK